MSRLTPNKHGDWINLRNDVFSSFIPLEPEQKFNLKTISFFFTFAIGVATNRDAWVYNFSKDALSENMKSMISFYNEQRKKFENEKKKNNQIQKEKQMLYATTPI